MKTPFNATGVPLTTELKELQPIISATRIIMVRDRTKRPIQNPEFFIRSVPLLMF
jgi:hypothetical protein